MFIYFYCVWYFWIIITRTSFFNKCFKVNIKSFLCLLIFVEWFLCFYWFFLLWLAFRAIWFLFIFSLGMTTLQYLWFIILPRHWNAGLVSSGASLNWWREGASLALVGDPSSDGVVIKMLYGVDVLHRPPSHPIFSYWVG